MDELLTAVVAAVVTVMELDDGTDLNGDTRLEDDLGFDSGLFIELIMELEDRVPGLYIDPNTLAEDDFVTIGALSRYVATALEDPVGHA